MTRPRILVLYCGVGIGADGYKRAGWDVHCVGIEPQPNNPHPYTQADAVDFLRRNMRNITRDFAAIHASPPCQAFSAYRRKGHGVGDGYPNLLPVTRSLLNAIGLPYVIENVEGAPLIDPVRLCGSSFGLDVRRHRLFETNWPLHAPPCYHGWQTPRFPAATNRAPNSRRTVEIGVWRIPMDVQMRAMGVEREVTREELSLTVPPAYTEHIGWLLLEHINAKRPQPGPPAASAHWPDYPRIGG